MKEQSYMAYRILSGGLALICLLIGTVLLAAFVSNTLLPYGMQLDVSPISTNYWGFYMMAFAGAVLFAWGGCLLSVVRAPALARGVGTATAFGLVVNAVFRMLAWFSGEYAEVESVPRVEAAIMLLLALGFLWLRPPRAEAPPQRER